MQHSEAPNLVLPSSFTWRDTDFLTDQISLDRPAIIFPDWKADRAVAHFFATLIKTGGLVSICVAHIMDTSTLLH